MYKYISNQDTILERIAINLRSNSKLTIVKGTSGTGKSFLLSCIKSQAGKEIFVYKLEGDYYLRSRDYYPFLKFINTMYQIGRAHV